MKSIVDLVRQRAEEHGHRCLYTILPDREDQPSQMLGFGDLALRASSLAARLHEALRPGERALLIDRPGLDYIVAFFASMMAGLIPVPCYPPGPSASRRRGSRLAGIRRDCEPTAVVASSATLVAWRGSDELEGLEPIASDGDVPADARAWVPPRIEESQPAFLQYTSGSTGDPRGVVVTHRNLLANSAVIKTRFGHSTASRGVIWLPPYHDMGLIGGIVQPLFAGFPVALMSPLTFLSNPLRWLRAITLHSATTSGGPNFAFDLCNRRVEDADVEGLDLSSWEVAFCGAEPIRAETLERFARKFEPAGFRRGALLACYGLAEATLYVSGGARLGGPQVVRCDEEALARKLAVPPEPQQKSVPFVACGVAAEGHEIVIVDPETGIPAPPGTIGEIWIAGESVAQGYWGRDEANAATFQARLDQRDGRFLRSGDLGFLQGAELVVTGRLKDLIIIAGRNIYPQDVEATVELHPEIRTGCACAFSDSLGELDRLVIWAELLAPLQGQAERDLVEAIRRSVSLNHGVRAHEVRLLRRGVIPKTTSGKIRRHECRDKYLKEALGHGD